MNFIKRLANQELPFIFASPALIWQFLFLYLPLIILIANSFIEDSKIFSFTFSIYEQAFNSIFLKVLLNSFWLALFTSVICFFIAYPIAYFIALKIKKHKTLFLFSLILPSWTSFIVQVYAWFFLLKKDGFISFFLAKIGLISENAHLLNNFFAILIGMAYCFLPFMILPIYTVLAKMDKKLIEASYDLGANQFKTFMRVIFPISLPGVMAGFLLVFVPAFGEFAVPDLLGGGKSLYWGTVIVDKFLISRDWKTGSALTITGIMSIVFIFILFSFLFNFLRKKISNKD
jgi:spermidine/putrescine transport system permease protein